jgi:uncharacterized protein
MARDSPLFLFAPGAGAGADSPWMQRYAGLLSTLGRVVAFDYDYRALGRKSPDPLPRLIAAHARALQQAAQGNKGRLVLIGKSMGGRVGCHLSLEPGVKVDGLICLGYPLQGMGKSGKLRDQVLLELRTPILFVQGTRDNLCPLPLLESVRRKMKAQNSLHVVDSGNHSLLATKTHLKQHGTSQAAIEGGVIDAISEFLGAL